jgi:hypothetical protein
MRITIALFAILLSTVPAAAQTPVVNTTPPAGTPAMTMADGMVAGQAAAQTVSTGGSFAGGFVGGLVLGLIGTGIAYAVQGPADIPLVLQASNQQHGSDYMVGFHQAFAEASKKKKRSSALTGGLAGTGVLVLLVVSAGSGG